MNAAKKTSAIDLSGLGKLSEMHGGAPKGGAPLELSIAQVGEDEDNVRKTYDADELAELAETIKKRGVLQPITVKPANAQGIHIIRWGHRRYRASKIAGLKTIPAIVKDDGKDDPVESIIRQVIENEQRANLSAMEMGEAVDKLIVAGLSQKQIAEDLGKPASIISLYAAYATFAEPIKTLPLPIRSLYELDRAHRLDADATLAFIKSFVDPKDMTKRETATFSASLRKPSAKTAPPPSLPGVVAPASPPSPSLPTPPESLSGQTPERPDGPTSPSSPESLSEQTSTPPEAPTSPSSPVDKLPSPPVDTAPVLTPKPQSAPVMDVILKGVLMQCLEELDALGAGDGPAASRVRQLLKLSATGPES